MASNFIPGRGRIAADLYDFKSHTDGYGFNHNASSISINNAGVPGSTNVEDALVALTISANSDAKQPFLVVGDGYDTWHNANGTINFDKNIPSLDLLLNPIFAAIRNKTPIPNGFDKIKNGGVVFIKSGTYIVKSTINVPAGITIMGEGFGTKIINANSLNFAPTPPALKDTPTQGPIFCIKANIDSNLVGDYVSLKETRLVNLFLSDNFIQEPIFGDTGYKYPQNDFYDAEESNKSLVTIEATANVELLGVYLIGKKILTGVNDVVANCSKYGIYQIGYPVDWPPEMPLYAPSCLKISDCVIDNFRNAITYRSLYGSYDELRIENSKIRSWQKTGGYQYSYTISVSDINVIIVNNDLVCGSGGISSSASILYKSGSYQNISLRRPKWIFKNNNLSTTDGENVQECIIFGTENIAANIDNNVGFAGIAYDTIGRNGLKVSGIRPVSGSFVLDSDSNSYGFNSKYSILTCSTGSAVSITLPTTASVYGRKLIIKDLTGTASTNNITITPEAPGTIDGGASLIINQNYASVTLICVSNSGAVKWIIV